MAMGLPVIASPVPAYKPVIEQGKNGYLAATRDDWVKYLKELRDPELRELMGQRARDAVINRFSKEEQARKLVAVFDSLCAQGIEVRHNFFSNPSCLL
jgi:glycosyltransferase involved in cell wall biosynthesis